MLRIGIAGIGFMGMTHYVAYQKIRGVRVAAICEKKFPERLAGDWRAIKGNFGPPGEIMDLAGVARYADFDDLIADPALDVVDCCLPPAAHPQATIAALKAGKHVFCEKPIALTAIDAARMVGAARKARRLLLVGHVLPYFPEYKFAYELVRGGKYGKPLGGHFKRIIADPAWLPDFFDPHKVGGPMLDLHVHDAHFIRLLFGMPKAVHTIGTMRGAVAERFATQFIYDLPKMVTAASGVIAQQGRPFTHAYEIYLEGATVFFDAGTPVTLLLDNGKVVQPNLGGGGPTEAFRAELGEVARSIRAGKPSALLGSELARDAVVLCQKQTESLVKGRTVNV
jgi:predicted dehydrogenase